MGFSRTSCGKTKPRPNLAWAGDIVANLLAALSLISVRTQGGARHEVSRTRLTTSAHENQNFEFKSSFLHVFKSSSFQIFSFSSFQFSSSQVFKHSSLQVFSFFKFSCFQVFEFSRGANKVRRGGWCEGGGEVWYAV